MTLPQPTPERVTVKAAAARLGCSTRLVVRLINQKRLPATKAGKSWSILKSDFETFLAAERPTGWWGQIRNTSPSRDGQPKALRVKHESVRRMIQRKLKRMGEGAFI